jgi:hypothetical protein
MPILRFADAPEFDLSGIRVRGLASPSRGSTESMSYRLVVIGGLHVPAHTLDHEEVSLKSSETRIRPVTRSFFEFARLLGLGGHDAYPHRPMGQTPVSSTLSGDTGPMSRLWIGRGIHEPSWQGSRGSGPAERS